MANVQLQFETFHNTIRLGAYEENATLREKRDRVLADLATGLKRLFEEKGQAQPKHDTFDQGSYKMNTGVKPLEGEDYDIDIGVIFHINHQDHNPVDVKRWVYDALQRPNRTVLMKGPCVTVQYIEDGEPDHHVDLAVYAGGNDEKGARHLARGKLNSATEHRIWVEFDPKGLIDKITSRHSGDDAAQYRRVIRDLKRWKQEKFSSGSPSGIGLTLCALNWFSPAKVTTDVLQGTVEYDDRLALENLTRTMISQFTGAESHRRLRVHLPVKPFLDVFEKLTDNHHENFLERLEALNDALEFAGREASRRQACKVLRKHFGDDFPVPDDDEAKSANRASYVGSGSGA